MLILRFLLTLALAWCAGQLVSKLKLPAILGWLIAGMALGPHGLALMGDAVLDAGWYNTLVHLLECAVGLMIGTELVGSKLRRSGRSILITTLTQSMGTFAVVSLVFGLVFAWQGIPVYLAFVFGGIALATAPAPALSIVREFDTHGPVTDTLLPMAALDDIVGCVVFFSVMAAVSGHLAQGSLPVWIIPLIILLPLALGALVGWPAGLLLKKPRGRGATLALVLGGILCTAALGMAASRLVPGLNFMLMGMAFSAVFANLVDEERLDSIMQTFQPVLGVGMIAVILNLGAPLDYHLVLGAGVFTALYILARAVGKYTGAGLCGGPGHPCPRHGAPVSGPDPAAPFRGIAGIHRRGGVGAAGPRAGLRPHPAGHHRGRCRDQRADRRGCRPAGLCPGGGTARPRFRAGQHNRMIFRPGW